MKILLAGLAAASALTAVATTVDAQPYGYGPGYGYGYHHPHFYGYRRRPVFYGPRRFYRPYYVRHCVFRHGYRYCR